MSASITKEAIEEAAKEIFECLGQGADPVLGMDFTQRLYRLAAKRALEAALPHLEVKP